MSKAVKKPPVLGGTKGINANASSIDSDKKKVVAVKGRSSSPSPTPTNKAAPSTSTSSTTSKSKLKPRTSSSSSPASTATVSRVNSRSVTPTSKSIPTVKVKSVQAAEMANDAISVYELKLEEDGSPSQEKKYIRLPAPIKPYILRFTIDAGSSASKDGSLWTNFPAQGKNYERNAFVERKLPTSFSQPIKVDLLIQQAGAFEFYVEHSAPDEAIPYPTISKPIHLVDPSSRKRVQSTHGYFNVDPILTIPTRSRILSSEDSPLPIGKGGSISKENQILSQDGIVLQSFIAKWAGSLSEWSTYLDSASNSGYNMLHFPPLQVRGDSNSPYSIADQLDFSKDLFDSKAGKSKTLTERKETMKSWIDNIKNKWGILSMTDVVWNHTANNSEWLNEHPDAAYNPVNSPHLTPAEELDRALISFSSRLEELGLPVDPKTSSDVTAIMEGVKSNVFSPLKLWQYYVLDVAAHKGEFAKASSTESSKKQINSVGEDDLRNATLEQAPALLEKYALRNRMTLGDRFTTHLDIPLSLSICQTLGESKSKEEIQKAFEKALDVINAPLYQIYDDDVKAALENLGGRLKYMRIEEGGPKMGKITKSSPLCEPYFTRLDPSHPAAKKHDPRKLALANNGWIWAADPLSDFASSKSRVYLRREVIAWGDCVKLRYGSKPSDNPFLWKHMEEYTTSLAKIFAGFRIDNCHSTPIHVGEYFLDAARRINPNLYVCAELFTGSAEMDVHFVSKLGINSLIREMENGHDPKEESRLLYRFGVNKPIGSMDTDCLSVPGKVTLPGSKTSSPCTVIPLQGSSPHALFMDVTHDNETPTLKRTTEDAITMGALVAFSWSAIGSTKGFDDLYPHLLNVVTETRKYEKDTQDKGINEVKRVFNHLHEEMVRDGYSEGHVHQENDYIMLHRVHPQTHKGYLCLAHTAFNDRGKARGEINPFKLNRTKAKFIFGKSLEITSRSIPEDKTTLRGLPSKLIDIPAPSMKEGEDHDGFFTEITVPENFPPGSVMLFSTYMDGLGSELETLCTSGATEAMSKLSLVDLNVMLHRADGEEKDVTDGADGTYTIPEYGQLVYCGLEGWMAPLRHVMNHNDLGHPVCAHLRAGTWALDYVHDRLKRQFKIFPNLEKPADWLKERFNAIKSTVPSFMRPKYFALVINEAYMAARQRAISQMSSFVTEGHDFTQSLALCAVQMNGMVKSASLWPDKDSASMAAGLPFFSASWARMWGRDVFISLRGLYLTTGMYAAAREHILSFGCTLKHGLIPNLLDSTRTPRYNCRDGPWYFAQNVQDYVNMVPGGESILSEKVPRRFPLDDEWVPWDDPKAFKHVSTVAGLIQEILQRHATGIHFREYNAGPNIDQHMKDEGFNIDIDVDWKTGLVMGGNAWNCGTWQDKNGSSTKAGNVGVPGSPRDGAAVEITGLLKSTLSWVDSLSKKGKWAEKGVTATIDGKKTQVSYKQWADLIQASFEKCYYVPLDPAEDSKYFVDTKLVNRRGIYKDVYGSGKGREWSDYQLRANYPIAMCVAPELFDPKRGLSSLQVVANVLRGPLGMRTLDPSDMNYRGDYDNSNDTTDFHLAQGWNYHNGPEWVFPTGFFLRAYLIFDTLSNGAGSGSGSTKGDINESFHLLSSMLLEHRKHIKTSPWAGLPELTNTNGKDCPDSCKTQAWSASTLLDLLQEMRVRESGSTQKVNGK